MDHSEHGLVIVRGDTPYVFAWDELESGSAFAAKRSLLSLERGGGAKLSAEDHFQLGIFALSHGRRDLAASEFRTAQRLDSEYRSIIREASAKYRRKKEDSSVQDHPLSREEEGPTPREPGLAEHVETELSRAGGISLAPGPTPRHREQVLEVYRTFGAKVREVIGREVALVESDHFLIWTDWEPRYHRLLTEWCESMYRALCVQFDLDPSGNVFLAKCPVFCWRSKARFRKFSRQFDGYSGADAVGYTRSIQQTGHVHVVLLRMGRSEVDFARFACTLVHEGTHAFLHRLYTTRLIPHWVNEGYADLMVERVLEDRSHKGENAALLARQFARYDWPVTELIHSVGPIEVHQYSLAHSVIAHLAEAGPERFAGFIRGLKAGEPTAAALAASYDGLTLDQLEARWRLAMTPCRSPSDL